MKKYEGKKLNLLQYLNQFSVVDTDPLSKYYLKFIEFPTTLTQGKNTIRFIGNTETLVKDSEIYIEILDGNSTPLYHEVLNYIDSDGATTISVYVTETTPIGNFTALFATTVNRDLKNQYLNISGNANYLWIGTGSITNSNNLGTIIFSNEQPSITIKEILSPFNVIKNRLVNVNIPTSSGMHVIGNVQNKFNLNSSQKNIELNNTVQTLPRISNSDTEANTGRIISNEVGYVYSNNFEFKPSMVGGTIVFKNINLSYISSNTELQNIGTYSASIVSLLNNTTVKVSPPFNRSINSAYNINEFKVGTYESKTYGVLNCSMSYFNNPPATSSAKTQSALLLDINKLNPSAGTVNAIQLYYKPVGELGTIYKEYGTLPITAKNLLRNTSSIDISGSYVASFINPGTFYHTGSFNVHWVLTDSKNQINNLTINSDSNLITNAINITSNVHTGSNDRYGFYLNKRFAVDLKKDTYYDLKFNVLCTNSDNPILEVYSSGSNNWIGFVEPKIVSLNSDNANYNKNIKYGNLIGTVSPKKNSTNSNLKFQCTSGGQLVLNFIMSPGNWYISDIELVSDSEFGVSHTYELITIESDIKRNIEYDFLIKYLNSNNQPSSYETKISGITFDGGNKVIEGDDNIISGSIYAVEKLDAILKSNVIKPYQTNKRSGFVSLQVSGSDLYGAAQLELLVNEYNNTHSYDPGRPKSAYRLFYISGSEVFINNVQPSLTASFDLRIQNNGKLVYAVSDENLKTDFSLLNLNIENKILSLPIGKFKYKNHNNWNYGMLAQNVESIFPEIVSTNNGIKTIDYNQLLALLIYYIQTKFKKD